MARARNIKPGFFTNADLVECEPLARLLFAGLWCEADRRGILEDRPKTLKIKILPGDNCDVDALLTELERHGFIERYTVEGYHCILILNFGKHQNPHRDEKANMLPAPYEHGASTVLAPDQSGLLPITDSLLPITDSLVGANAPLPEKPKNGLVYSDEFLTFWQQYPTGHGTKTKAYAEWQKLRPDEDTRFAMLAALAKWNACELWQEGKVVYAERFLKYRVWEDEPAPPKAEPAPRKNAHQESIDRLMRVARGEQP